MKKIHFIMKPAFLLICLVLFSAISFSQSIWSVINPTPPWDEYVDVHFFDDQTGYALGEEGRLIKTSNGGIDWVVLNNKICVEPKDFYFLDPDNGWVAGYNGIYKTVDGGINWQNSFGNGENGFYTIYFVSENMGFVSDYYGKIFKTNNGGISWSLVYEDNYDVKKIFFVDEETGWTLYRYYVIKTVDGGNTWSEPILHATTNSFNDMCFIDENTGWVAANKSLLLQTINGGISWDTIPVTTSQNEAFQVVHFFNELKGKVFSENQCYNTFDGGNYWEIVDIPIMENRSVSLPTETYICSVDEEIAFTTDGGFNWSSPDIGHTNHQTALCINSDNKIYITGDNGKIISSEDNGGSWNILQTPSDDYLTDICCVNNTVLWAAGNNGTVLHTENGGEWWNVKDIGTNYNLNSISFPSEQVGCIVGKNSSIFMTHDGGALWTNVSGPPSAEFNNVFFINEYLGWVCGDDGTLMKTVDGGISWLLLNSNTTKDLYGLHFFDENKGWVSGKELIISTDDGGQNWYTQLDNLLNPNNGDRIYSIQFIDADNGWATGMDGLLLHTKDGGINWVVHERVITDDLLDIEFSNINEGFAVGELGYILHTNQGTYLAPKVISQPDDTIVCENTYISFECQAIGDSLNYQWLYGIEEIPAATENILIFDSISIYQGGLYSCKVFNGAGTVKSEKFMVSIKPKVNITGHPQNALYYENDTITFHLAVTGALPINYQWQKNGVDIEGAIYNVYPVYGLQLADSGYYRCIVSNDCSLDTTNEAKLTVFPASSVHNIKNGNTFSIVPNPVKSNCRISFHQLIDKGQYEIYSINGDNILSGKIHNTKYFELDLTNLLPGIYLIQVKSGEKLYSTKFVKE